MRQWPSEKSEHVWYHYLASATAMKRPLLFSKIEAYVGLTSKKWKLLFKHWTCHAQKRQYTCKWTEMLPINFLWLCLEITLMRCFVRAWQSRHQCSSMKWLHDSMWVSKTKPMVDIQEAEEKRSSSRSFTRFFRFLGFPLRQRNAWPVLQKCLLWLWASYSLCLYKETKAACACRFLQRHHLQTVAGITAFAHDIETVLNACAPCRPCCNWVWDIRSPQWQQGNLSSFFMSFLWV